MKKRIVSLMLVLVCCVGILTACGEPPKAAPKEKFVDVADIDWKITIEGVPGVTEYTMAEAKELKFSKTYASTRGAECDQGGEQITSRAYEGAKLTDILEDIGVKEYTSITFIDTDGVKYDLAKTLTDAKGTVVAWIENKTMSIADSEALVCVASDRAKDSEFVRSLATIVVNP